MSKPARQESPTLPEGAKDAGRHIAEGFAGLSWDDLPDQVRDVTARFLLDTLGVIAGAVRAPGIAAAIDTLATAEPEGTATVLLSDTGRGASIAALLNGAAGHALDFDDQHDPARVHAFCVVLPAALAAADVAGPVDGKRFLLALALGVELHCRLGLACYNSLGKGWHPTAGHGTLAAAMAAGTILGLDAVKLNSALGLAYAQMGGTTQFIADGVLAKRLGPGMAARGGVTSAILARGGLTGPHRWAEGKAGLFLLHERGEVRPEILTQGIGSRWHILDLSMKPYPCCRCVHSTIQLGLALHEKGQRPNDIAKAEIRLGRVNHGIVGADFDITHDNPVVHAQFNACYGLSIALTDGRADLASFTAERIRAEQSRLAERFRCVVSDSIEPTALAPAEIELTLTDGSTILRATPSVKGAPDDPMSDDEMLAKFSSCLAWGHGPRHATPDEAKAHRALAARILNTAVVSDISEIIADFRSLAARAGAA